MRALVVYESMFGNTREIAERVVAGLRTAFDDVDLVRVGEADAVSVLDTDLLVVGGPTHAHGLSVAQTRAAAVADPERYGMGAPVEPGAEGIGLREWFRGLPRMSCVGAAFDTKADAPAAFTGRASIVLARRMRRSGLAMVDEPKSFLVAKSGGLKSGEADRAERWGQLVASQATSRLSAGLQRRAQ